VPILWRLSKKRIHFARFACLNVLPKHPHETVFIGGLKATTLFQKRLENVFQMRISVSTRQPEQATIL